MKKRSIAATVAAAMLVPFGAAAASAAPQASPVPAGEGRMIADELDVVPVDRYRLSARYGQRGSLWSSGRHTGLDFSASKGTRVNAASGGKVTFSGSAGPYGQAIIVKHHNGLSTLYAHLSKRSVKKGKTVSAGQRIGKVGSTGNSTGPHLHFEVRNKKGQQVNPAKYLRGE